MKFVSVVSFFCALGFGAAYIRMGSGLFLGIATAFMFLAVFAFMLSKP